MFDQPSRKTKPKSREKDKRTVDCLVWKLLPMNESQMEDRKVSLGLQVERKKAVLFCFLQYSLSLSLATREFYSLRSAVSQRGRGMLMACMREERL